MDGFGLRAWWRGKREGKPSPQPRLARNKVLLFSAFRLQHLFLDQLRDEGEGLTDPLPKHLLGLLQPV